MNLREELLNKSNSSFELITTHVMMELIEQARQELIKELIKFHGGIHPRCNICKIEDKINEVLGKKEGK